VILRQCLDKAVRWLRDSNICIQNGGYRSVYSPTTGQYYCWGGGNSCLINTAGSVLVFLEIDDIDRALASADHIFNLSIRDRGRFHGAIPAGENSKYIYAYYIAFAIRALTAIYRRTGIEKYLEASISSARWVIANMMNGDGSISEVMVIRNRNLRDVFANQFVTWQSVFLGAFIELGDLTGDKSFKEAESRLLTWIKNIQNEDGSLPVCSKPFINRLAYSAYSLNYSNLRNNPERRHATGNSTALEAFVLSSSWENAERLYSWMAGKLGENGLLYQYYFANGKCSIEEDVMPTAYFGITMLENLDNSLFRNSVDICERIANGMRYAQVTSNDLNSDGGIKGLPLHETEDQNIYCWDTQYGILFMNKMLSMRGRPSGEQVNDLREKQCGESSSAGSTSG